MGSSVPEWKKISCLTVIVLASIVGYQAHSFGLFERISVVFHDSLKDVRNPGKEKTDSLIEQKAELLRNGDWREVHSSQLNSSQSKQDAVNDLRGLGYLSGTQEPPEESGIVKHKPDKTYRGYNLVVSGHAPEATLMTMDGNVVHKWKVPWEKAFPETPKPSSVQGNPDEKRDFWRKVYLYPNGDILAIYDYLGIVKVDRDSNVIWSRKNGAHHDVRVGDDGRIHLLTARKRSVPEVNESNTIVDDYITVLSPDGERLKQFSLLSAILNSNYSSVLDFSVKEKDILHTNSIQILRDAPDRLKPAFEDGNVLISQRNTSLVAVVDLPENEVTWSLMGIGKRQHSAKLLSNGNLMLFDNLGNHGWSKVIEINPINQDVEWGFFGNEENKFRTKCCGDYYRLPNGNTLIIETEPGRAFEVTPDGEVVWKYISPHRTKDPSTDKFYIAALFDMPRYSPAYVEPWLGEPPGPEE